MFKTVVFTDRRFTDLARWASSAVAESELVVIGVLAPCLGAES